MKWRMWVRLLVMAEALLVLGGCTSGGDTAYDGGSSVGSSGSAGSSASGGGAKTIQGSGNVTRESRNVSNFNQVELQGIGNLTIQQTGSESLTIEAEDNIIPYLKTEVKNNRLTLSIEPGVGISTTKPINYELTVKDLSDLKLTGSGMINVESINTNNLKITTTGSGNVSANTDTNTLEVVLGGSGDAKMDGKADSQDVNITGSSRYQAENLQSRETKVDISGSGSATLNVSDTLDARIAGSGSVEYAGNPTVSKQISGSGELRKR